MNGILLNDIKYIVEHIEIDKCRDKTFLITGANGLLGRYIVEVLMYLNKYVLDKDKCKVIAICRNKIGAEKKFAEYLVEDEFKLVIQNVEDEISYRGTVNYIIHTASQANTRRFSTDPVGTLSSNTIGTYNLLKYANEKQIEGFLFFSSGAVYGDTSYAREFVKENEFFPLDPLDINSCYAEGKRMGENMCFSFYKQYKVPTKIIRIGHTYGPGINLNDGRVFSDFVRSILNNEDLIIQSDGQDKRAFCYLSDAVIAFFLVLFKGESGEAYNMANNKDFITIRELAETLVYKVFKEKRLDVVYQNNNRELGMNNKSKVSVNIDKIAELGWSPKVRIEQGFKRTVMSFLEGDK